jgi:hypothetical protein
VSSAQFLVLAGIGAMRRFERKRGFASFSTHIHQHAIRVQNARITIRGPAVNFEAPLVRRGDGRLAPASGVERLR